MHLIQQAQRIMDQLDDLTEQLDSDEFQRSLPILQGNSVGKHLRHILEFFDQLIEGSKSGIVDYDHRAHDKSVESDRLIAREKIKSLQTIITELAVDKQLSLSCSYDLSTGERLCVGTTLHRELIYNIEHAIHHMAIIRLAVYAVFPNVSLSETFGIAASTVRYQRTHSISN